MPAEAEAEAEAKAEAADSRQWLSRSRRGGASGITMAQNALSSIKMSGKCATGKTQSVLQQKLERKLQQLLLQPGADVQDAADGAATSAAAGKPS